MSGENEVNGRLNLGVVISSCKVGDVVFSEFGITSEYSDLYEGEITYNYLEKCPCCLEENVTLKEWGDLRYVKIATCSLCGAKLSSAEFYGEVELKIESVGNS